MITFVMNQEWIANALHALTWLTCDTQTVKVSASHWLNYHHRFVCDTAYEITATKSGRCKSLTCYSVLGVHESLVCWSCFQEDFWFLINLFVEQCHLVFLSTVLDAGGKLPPGVLEGNFNWLGAYDECVKIVAQVSNPETNSTALEKIFGGRYCTAAIGMAKQNVGNTTPNYQNLCVVCPAQEIQFQTCTK